MCLSEDFLAFFDKKKKTKEGEGCLTKCREPAILKTIRFHTPWAAKETPKQIPKQTSTKMPSLTKSKGNCHFETIRFDTPCLLLNQIIFMSVHPPTRSAQWINERLTQWRQTREIVLSWSWTSGILFWEYRFGKANSVSSAPNRVRNISPEFSCITFFWSRDVLTQIGGHPGRYLSKTTEKGTSHKAFVRDIQGWGQGYPDVWSWSPRKILPKNFIFRLFFRPAKKDRLGRTSPNRGTPGCRPLMSFAQNSASWLWRTQVIGWKELTELSPRTRWGPRNSLSLVFETVLSETVI